VKLIVTCDLCGGDLEGSLVQPYYGGNEIRISPCKTCMADERRLALQEKEKEA